MEDKSIKDFDRAIEQAMNEHAVAPPFGAWNRIAAELDAPVAAPIAAGRAFPVAAVGGFVAGALFLGSVVAGVLIYNGNQLDNITQPVAGTTNTPVTTTVSETTTATPVATGLNNVAEANEVAIAAVMPQVSKKAVAVKAAPVAAAENETKVLANNNDVAVPQVRIAKNTNPVSTPYYFPPVDITMDEQPIQKNAVAEEMEAVEEETSSKPAGNTEVRKRSSSSSYGNFRGIKFKKKRSKFTYGRIISTKKH